LQCGRPTKWRPFGGTFDRPALLERRPDLKQVLLDAANTFTESPYLDIVNEVLERLVGDDPYETLRAWSHPFGLPFALRSERLKKYLHYLQVSPEELYRLFASRVDHDIVAREYLGLSPEDIAVVTTVLTADGIRLLWGDGSAAVPFAWFERAGVEGCSGDILSARNRDYRFRLATSIEVAESDIVDIVRRYRERYNALEPSPFDRGDIGLTAIALLHRVGRLANALGIAVDELFDVQVEPGDVGRGEVQAGPGTGRPRHGPWPQAPGWRRNLNVSV
jgi:hypothetical protein